MGAWYYILPVERVSDLRIKTRLLKLLEDNKDAYVSGNDIAKELSVSRNSIWKAVKSLRAEGYEISALTNNGYRLESSGDVISIAGITRHFKSDGVFIVDVMKSVTSTNTVMRDLAVKGMPEGCVLAAEGQTAGKGRLGRGFHSPAGHGAYFSLLLRPGSRTKEAALITSAAAVASARAIEEVMGVESGIKWVNDLLVGGKKVCGILTEAVFDMESGMVESAVLGIGINTTRPKEGFPKSLEGIAAPLADRVEGKDGERCRLIATTLENFWGYYQNLENRGFLDEYRARSVILGKDIYVLSGSVKTPARAIAIDDECGLVVRYENGETATISSGEVSVRAM